MDSYFVSALSGLQWGLLALVPPAILLLYFLKLKRKPILVPSTYLWSRVIEDLHVNSIWQRLRQSILLFLQLLLVSLAAFALLRPGYRGAELVGDRFIFIVDNSSSMSATDVSPSRLAEAKKQAKEMIERMKSDDVGMLISFSDRAKVLQSFTNNKRLLLAKLAAIEPTTHRTDLAEAMTAAAGLANPGRSSDPNSKVDVQVAAAQAAEVVVFSDGGFPRVDKFALGNLTATYKPIGKSTVNNVGITAFETEKNPERPDQLQAFATVENFSDEAKIVGLTCTLNDEILDAKSIQVPARSAEGKPGLSGADFSLPTNGEGIITLKIDEQDDFEADNSAYAVINPPRPANVLFVGSTDTDKFQIVLSTPAAEAIANTEFVSPSYLEGADYKEKAATGVYDLVIFDQCSPKEPPQANTIFLGEFPSWGEWKKSEPSGSPYIQDVDLTHPLTQLLDVTNLLVASFRPVESPPGGVKLIDADRGGVYCVAPRGSYEDAVLGFSLSTSKGGSLEPNTDWPRKRSFPVFIMNALKYFGGSRSSTGASNGQPGVPFAIRTITPSPTVNVTTPRGITIEAIREGSIAPFNETDELGVYSVKEGSGAKIQQHFTINLFDQRESDILPAEKIDIGYEEVKAKPKDITEIARKEYWKWILLAGLFVLALEWYIYNKRVYL